MLSVVEPVVRGERVRLGRYQCLGDGATGNYYMNFRLVFFYLRLAHSKGQGQGCVHFYCECLVDGHKQGNVIIAIQ